MVTQAGIGVLIGLGIGSGVTAFLMQRIIRRQDNALQQSLTRLNRIQADHAQELNAALEKMALDHEQQLATKIERYQDTHEEQLSELEAEYTARIAAFTNLDPQQLTAPTPIAESLPLSNAIPSDPAPTAEASQSSAVNTFRPIPDPWTDPGSASAAGPPVAPPEAETAPEPVATGPSPTTTAPTTPEEPEPKAAPARANPRPFVPPAIPHQATLAQTATELGKAAAVNHKSAIRAIPQLGKLIKNQDADVRLAAVTALQESGSIKAIPFFRQALRDTDNRVVAVASAALGRFKGTKKTARKTKKLRKKRRH